MKLAAISNAWERCFPGVLPAGHLMRSSCPDRWLRVHSLPRSKRYAETESEYAELLRRYYSAAHALLGEAELCYFIAMRYGEETAWTASEPEGVFPTSMEHVMTAHVEDEQLQFFATEVVWEAQKHDALLRAVADDVTGSVAVFSPSRGSVFAPYDGGADLFFPHEAATRFARSRFSQWLSARPDGL